MSWPTRGKWFTLGDIRVALGLPYLAVTIFGAAPAAAAVVVAVRGGSSLPWPLIVVLLTIAVAANVGDELGVKAPESFLGLTGIAALVPVIVSGSDRLALVIAWFLVFRAVALGSWYASGAVLTASIGLAIAAGATDPGVPAPGLVFAGVVVVWLSGLAARTISRIVVQMRDADHLLAAEAARDERRKLAREVHDVIAHSMTVTLLHVNGARLALRDEPDAADVALQRAERVGRASLEDLRRTVKLLSESSDPTPGTTVDLGADLERLREGFSGAIERLSMGVTGDTESVSPFVALTVFRIVQESITNAVRHAHGSCVHVAIDVGDERVTMRIEYSMGSRAEQPNGSGRGLRGMFERAALLDGNLKAGPTKDGWLVSGWVPRGAPPAGVELL